VLAHTCQAHKASLQALWGPTLFHLDDLPYGGELQDMPDVFTPFRDKVEKKCQVGGLMMGHAL
jgi:deoxyribodipyrimidine photo-lyase